MKILQNSNSSEIMDIYLRLISLKTIILKKYKEKKHIQIT